MYTLFFFLKLLLGEDPHLYKNLSTLLHRESENISYYHSSVGLQRKHFTFIKKKIW